VRGLSQEAKLRSRAAAGHIFHNTILQPDGPPGAPTQWAATSQPKRRIDAHIVSRNNILHIRKVAALHPRCVQDSHTRLRLRFAPGKVVSPGSRSAGVQGVPLYAQPPAGDFSLDAPARFDAGEVIPNFSDSFTAKLPTSAHSNGSPPMEFGIMAKGHR